MLILAELERLYHHLSQNLGSEPSLKSIKDSLSICKSMDEAINNNPLKTLGLFYSSVMQDETTLCQLNLARLANFIHLCKSNQYNVTTSCMLSMSFLLSLTSESADNQNRSKIRKTLIRQLRAMHYEAAIEILSISKLINIENPLYYASKMNLSTWQWFAVCSTFLLPNRRVLNWQEQLAKTFNLTPNTMHEYLSPLLLYPSYYPPGTSITYNELQAFVVSSAEHKLVINTGGSNFLVNSAHCTISPSKEVVIDALNNAIHDIEHQQLYPKTYRINSPPKSLLTILAKCKQPNLDIDELARSVDLEPSFANFICDAAGNSNRLNLSVSSVKQGLMTYGFERLSDMLITHALFERLTQHNFPLKKTFVDHLRICSAIAAALAKQTELILPQSACLITLVCHASLFTEKHYKHITSWQTDINHTVFGFDKLLGDKSNSNSKKTAIEVAKAWNLSTPNLAIIDKVFKSHQGNVNPNASIICLALYWSLAIKHGQAFYNNKTNLLDEARLVKAVGINPHQKHAIICAVSDVIYCSL